MVPGTHQVFEEEKVITKNIMRVLACCLLCLAHLSWANPQLKIQQLSSQLTPLWNVYRPLCVMALPAKQQFRVEPRTQILDEFLTGDYLSRHLLKRPHVVHYNYWNNPLWQIQEEYEAAALAENQREPMREYFYKLQVQEPNPERAMLITRLQQTATQLNLALREGLWKTCFTLGLEGVALEKAEDVVEHRWQRQRENVETQLEQALAAFYFYAYRHVANEELKAMVELHESVIMWTQDMVEGVQDYFEQLRLVVLAQPLPENPSGFNHSEVAPFLSSPQWHPGPSQSQLQP